MSSSNHAVKSDNIIAEDSVTEANQTESESDSNHQLQLASSSETLEIKPLEPRLKTFEAFIGRVTQVTDDLGQSIKRLTGRVDESEDRLDDLEPTSELLEYTSRELVTKVAELDATDMALDDRVRHAEAFQGQLDSRTSSLEDEVQAIHTATAVINEDIQALQRRSVRIEEAAEQQDNDIIGLASRLNYLEPKHKSLQLAHDKLALHTIGQDDQLDNLDDRLIKTSWVAGGVVLVLTAAIATSYWYTSGTDPELTQQIAGIENDITGQATSVAEIYETNAQLSSSNENMSQQISKIESRIYASAEDLSGAPVDLDTVNSTTWLNAQPAGSYTVQLSGAYSKRAVADMIGKHNGAIETSEFAWFKTVNNGRDWFVLLHGSYASFDNALAEMEALPESLLKGGAYIRTIGGVQKSLQRH